MHNAGYQALALDFLFLALEVEPALLGQAVAGARALGFRGCSVTKPFKEAVIPLLDHLDGTAAAIGAVNTVLNENGVLSGFNSDWIGAVRAIEEAAGVGDAGRNSGEAPAPGSLSGLRVCIAGAGGAGKAIAWGLKRAGCTVVLFNRDTRKGKDAADLFGVEFGGASAEIPAAGPFDAFVNATSVGMGDAGAPSPIPPSALRAGNVVLDAVIRPRNTALLRAARAARCRAVPGARMLLYQGLFQFRLFTGVEPPAAAMSRALDRALR
jgi:shikimate dehydrogenase